MSLAETIIKAVANGFDVRFMRPREDSHPSIALFIEIECETEDGRRWASQNAISKYAIANGYDVEMQIQTTISQMLHKAERDTQ